LTLLFLRKADDWRKTLPQSNPQAPTGCKTSDWRRTRGVSLSYSELLSLCWSSSGGGGEEPVHEEKQKKGAQSPPPALRGALCAWTAVGGIYISGDLPVLRCSPRSLPGKAEG